MIRGDTVRVAGRLTRYVVRQRIGQNMRLTAIGPGRIRDCQVPVDRLIRIINLPGRSGFT
jgi:hypothetical protein